MTRDELKQVLAKLLAEALDIDDASGIDEHASFTDLGLSSVAMVDLVLAVDKQTGIHLTADDLLDATTVGDLIDTLQRIAKG